MRRKSIEGYDLGENTNESANSAECGFLGTDARGCHTPITNGRFHYRSLLVVYCKGYDKVCMPAGTEVAS